MTKTLLLTGSTGEIGAAIFNKFQKNNFEIIAPSRAEMDLSDVASINSFMLTLKNPIDVFIHCAGFNSPKPVGELLHEDVEKTMQVNTFSFYDIIFHLLPQFKANKNAYVLGVSSMYGSFSRQKRLAYSASKHALNGMIKTLALELGRYNIKVNGIAPGFVDTKMTHKNNSEAVIEAFKQKIPLGNLAHANDIANACYFLCSPENGYINGEILTIDGGYSIGGFEK
ncbi:MAG: SDR family oxidoreductase [Coxiellaceae bacterium]|nr:SDR family oxidoreductase [Coxiellaceae bacterium]